MSRVGRAQTAQMKKLLDILTQDGLMKNGTVVYKNLERQNFWRRIAIQLNAVEGGVTKSSYKWCTMWTDWKTKTKKKANILSRRQKHSSMQHSRTALTELELCLLKIINYPLENHPDINTTPNITMEKVRD